ncbi:hypothetical protein [Vibrio mexicanus]|uniref:hypothetical protein n=1 Tax=Vibrio mexicanus TaxID=1004326 RepID=UPI00063CAFE2|nr:hypothetical protein [Vibrio mexicanus]
MNTYQIATKNGVFIAVDILSDTAGEELRSFKDQGFILHNDLVTSPDSDSAISIFKASKPNFIYKVKAFSKSKAGKMTYGLVFGTIIMILLASLSEGGQLWCNNKVTELKNNPTSFNWDEAKELTRLCSQYIRK